jgi:hypothetical protein
MKVRCWKFFVHLNCAGTVAMALALNHPVLANPPNVGALDPDSVAQSNPGVVVDGVEFTTLISNTRRVSPGGFTLIDLGIRIANRSSSAKRFRADLLVLNVLEKDQKSVFPNRDKCKSYSSVLYLFDPNVMYITVKPGESFDLFKDIADDPKGGGFSIAYTRSDDGRNSVCRSGEIKPGKYSVFVTYQGESKRVIDMYSDGAVQEQIWKKTVNTPLQSVDLLEIFKPQ